MTNRHHKKLHAGKVTVLLAKLQQQLLGLIEKSKEPADLSYNASLIARSCFDHRHGYPTRKLGMPFHLKLELCEAVMKHGMTTFDKMTPKSLSWFVFALGRMYADLYSGWPLSVHGRMHPELPGPFRDALYAAIVSVSKDGVWDPHSCSRLIVALSNLCPTHPSPEVLRVLVECIQQAVESESFGAQATTRIAQTFAMWAEQGWMFNTAELLSGADEDQTSFDDNLVQCLDSLTWKADEVMEDFMPGQIAKLVPALAKIQVGTDSNMSFNGVGCNDNYVSLSFLRRVEHRIATIGASLSGSNIVDVLTGFDEFNVRPSARLLDFLESKLLSNDAFAGVYHLETPNGTGHGWERPRGPGTMGNVLSLMKHAIGFKSSSLAGHHDEIEEQGYDLFEEDGLATEAVGLPLAQTDQQNNEGRPLQLVEMAKYLHACASMGIMLPNRNPQLYTAMEIALGDLRRIVKGFEGVRTMPTWYLRNTALDAAAASQLLWALSVFGTIGTSVCAPHVLTLLLDSMAATTSLAESVANYPRARKEAVLKDTYTAQLRLHEVFTAIGQLKAEDSIPSNLSALVDIVDKHQEIVKVCADAFAREQLLAPVEQTAGLSPRNIGNRFMEHNSQPTERQLPYNQWASAVSQLSQESAGARCLQRGAIIRKEFQTLVSQIEPTTTLNATTPGQLGGHSVAAWLPSKGVALDFYGPYCYTISTDPKQRPRLNGAAILKERAISSGGADLSSICFYEWSADDADPNNTANSSGGSPGNMVGRNHQHNQKHQDQQQSLAPWHPEPFPEVVEKIGENFCRKQSWRDWLSVKLRKMTLY